MGSIARLDDQLPPGLGTAPPARRGGDLRVALQPQGWLEGERAVALLRCLALLSEVPGLEVEVDLGAVPVLDRAVAQCLRQTRDRLVAGGGALHLVRVRTQPGQTLGRAGLVDGARTRAAAPAGQARGGRAGQPVGQVLAAGGAWGGRAAAG